MAAKATPKSAEPIMAGSGSSKTLMVYSRMRSEIADGVLEPGRRLAEADLVERYGVSRTPIREALVRLEVDGLVTREGLMVWVRVRTPDEVIDVYRVRVYLEGAIARDAATRRSEADMMRLDAALARSSALPANPTGLQMQHDNQEFHVAMAVASHNFTLQELQGRLTAQVTRLPSTTLRVPGRWKQSLKEHEEIVAHIRSRDPERAEKAARDHLEAARDIRLKLMAEEMAQ